MLERPVQQNQNAILVHLDFSSVDYAAESQEFLELAKAAGVVACACVGGKRQKPDASLYAGSGKVEEIAALAQAHDAQLVIFNHSLSPSQERNLEKAMCTRVLDRSGLILDIFAQRARTHEGKLQVELAQLQHLSTRLVRGWSHLERQKGGVGLRGPGETQLETDRRLLRDRVKNLKNKLDKVRKRREQSRNARKKNQIPTVSLVGYTNAGKSTLFNSLTGNETFASNQVFATLDPTLRRLPLPPAEHIVLADTVGFIRDLPHDLVAAFRATLEESRDASLLLHVVDAADAEREVRIAQVNTVLEEIGADKVPTILVMNKIDLREDNEHRVEVNDEGKVTRVYVSAVARTGLEELRQIIRDFFYKDMAREVIHVPPQYGGLRSQLFEHEAVIEETVCEDGGWDMTVFLPRPHLKRLMRNAGLEFEQDEPIS